MGISLEHLAGNLTLAALKTKIRQKEEAGFELVTLARGRLGGQATNLATFRERSDGSDPGDIDLVPIPAGESREAHESRLDDGEEGGRSFISYAAVFVSSAETNVAGDRA